MTPPHGTNGSIHGMSLLVGELKGAIEAVTRTVDHLNNNFKMKEGEAARQREQLHDKFSELTDVMHSVKSEVQTVRTDVEAVQQDVAEMKNDMEIAKITLADYEKNKPIALTAIGDVTKIKEFVSAFERKEQRLLGWWDIVHRIGAVGWTIICAIGSAALGLVVYWLQG